MKAKNKASGKWKIDRANFDSVNQGFDEEKKDGSTGFNWNEMHRFQNQYEKTPLLIELAGNYFHCIRIIWITLLTAFIFVRKTERKLVFNCVFLLHKKATANTESCAFLEMENFRRFKRETNFWLFTFESRSSNFFQFKYKFVRVRNCAFRTPRSIGRRVSWRTKYITLALHGSLDPRPIPFMVT